MKELLKKLNINPTYEDYRECRYRLIELAESIANLEIAIASMKEENKIYEAERVAEIKNWEKKMTIKDIEAIIKKELEEKTKEILDLDARMKISKAQYESVDKFLKAVDSSLYYLNNNKNDI